MKMILVCHSVRISYVGFEYNNIYIAVARCAQNYESARKVMRARVVQYYVRDNMNGQTSNSVRCEP